MNIIILSLSFLLSLLLTLYGTPIAQKVAQRYNILDVPDGNLKKQKKPVPYMGGVVVYFAFISPVSLMWDFNKELLGILFAGSILLIVGLFDDLKAMTPGNKFLFQIIGTYIAVKSGIHIDLAILPNWLDYVLSFFWILSIINAFNIIDIMDGFAASVGFLSAVTLFIITMFNQNFLISILTLSLAAALLGFLKFNWQPAKIYLGDSGSMFLGLVFGAFAIMGDYTQHNNLAFISGFIILGIPIFDMVYVIIIRLLKGKSPFFGSPDHFALRLKKKFSLDAAGTVRVIIAIQAVLCGIVILNYYTTPLVTAISTSAIFLFFLIFGIWLGRVDMES